MFERMPANLFFSAFFVSKYYLAKIFTLGHVFDTISKDFEREKVSV